MRKVFLALSASLLIFSACTGCSQTDGLAANNPETEHTAAPVSKSSEPLSAADESLDGKKCLTGLFGGWSRIEKTMWVSLTEDIDEVEEGRGVTIQLNEELEEQVLDFEIGDMLYVYYDDISVTDEPLIAAPYKVILAE